MARIIVIGCTNTDMVVRSSRIPVPGETVTGGTFLLNPGGKGANQAVACARLGGETTFVAKVGPRAGISVGDSASFALDLSNAHLYDPDTEERLDR